MVASLPDTNTGNQIGSGTRRSPGNRTKAAAAEVQIGVTSYNAALDNSAGKQNTR
jgi:hypothetical protein